MKKWFYPIMGLVLIALVISCAGRPAVLEVSEEDGVEVVVIDHKNKALGGNAPKWVFLNIQELEALEKYADSYVFKVEVDGKDKDGALAMLRGMEVPTMVARQVSLRVKNKFVGAQVGDKDLLETYMENVTKSIAEAQFSGLREVDNYWVKLQKGSRKFYRVLLFVTVPRDEIAAAIDRALNQEGDKPKTEEEKRARELVKNAFGNGLD